MNVHDQLADIAHYVESPFTEKTIKGCLEDRLYRLTVRDVGELAAAFVILHGAPRAESNIDLLKIIEETSRHILAGERLQRFAEDEMAICHAAQVYLKCVDTIEPVS